MRHASKATIGKGKQKQMGMVLIANSSEIQRRVIQRMMAEAGHSTMVARSGGECVDLVDKNEIELDCVLLDSHISNQYGIDVLESIKTLDEDLPVVILAAGSRSGVESNYGKLGADGVVSTPTDQKVLLAEVKRVMLNKHSAKSAKAHQSSPSYTL